MTSGRKDLIASTDRIGFSSASAARKRVTAAPAPSELEISQCRPGGRVAAATVRHPDFSGGEDFNGGADGHTAAFRGEGAPHIVVRDAGLNSHAIDADALPLASTHTYPTWQPILPAPSARRPSAGLRKCQCGARA